MVNHCGPEGNESVPVVISYGAGKSIQTSAEQGIAPRIGLRPGQAVTVAVQFPPKRAGKAVTLSALDGGTITPSAKEFSVQSDGSLRFGFQAGDGPGLYGISIQLAGNELRAMIIQTELPEIFRVW